MTKAFLVCAIFHCVRRLISSLFRHLSNSSFHSFFLITQNLFIIFISSPSILSITLRKNLEKEEEKDDKKKNTMIPRLVTSPSNATAMRMVINSSRNRTLSLRFLSSTPPQSPSSVSFDKMATDKRYQPTMALPESLLNKDESEQSTSSKFSIRGQFREGRAA